MAAASVQSISRDHSSLSVSQRKEVTRVEKICNALAAKQQTPPWAKTVLNSAGPILSTVLKMLDAASPYVVQAATMGYAFYQTLPKEIITALYGLALCFFGGHFTVSLAAAEAFRVCGGERVQKNLLDLYEDFQAVRAANKIDNKKDDDNDGVFDVDVMDEKALLSRKVGLVMKTVNPDRIMQALGGLAQAFAGVIATLKMQFARTVALAVSISDNLRKPMGLILTPILAALIPPEYHHWVAPTINISCKVVGMWLAWILARIIATCHSSMLGGLLAARTLVTYAHKKKLIKFEVDDSWLDEITGWTLCGLGIWFQLSSGLQLPFPLNLILFPLSFLEWYLTWAVTWFK